MFPDLFKAISRRIGTNFNSADLNIFKSALNIAIFTIAARIIIVARELVLAREFGRSGAVDAFLIAFLVPSFLITVIAGSFNSGVVPTYIRVFQQKGSENAQSLFSLVLLFSTGILILSTLLMLALSPLFIPLLTSEFPPDKAGLTQELLLFLAPVVVIRGVGILFGAFLNAREKFLLVAVVPVLTPLIVILGIVIFAARLGIHIVVFGTVVGTISEMILLAYGLKRRGIKCNWRKFTINDSLREIMKQSLPVMAGAFLMGGTTLVDQSMAATLKSGSVAALNYAHKVIVLPLGLLSLALGAPLLTYFSKMLADGDISGVRGLTKKYLILIFAGTIPLTLIFIFFSEPLIKILFERGAFQTADTIVVSKIQAYYALQIPFFTAGILIVRLISALRMNWILFLAAGLNLFSNILLNYIFMRIMGVKGIALSTAAVYLISFLFCWTLAEYQMNRKLKLQDTP